MIKTQENCAHPNATIKMGISNVTVGLFKPIRPFKHIRNRHDVVPYEFVFNKDLFPFAIE